MANTNVFRGSDGALVLAVDTGVEGEQAQAIIDEYNLTPVGRVKSQNWSYGIPEDDFVMERADFRALWISVEDTEG